ncbi:hypothetical protein [Streptomyces sp. NPDC005322]|uniref:hypothetical protein n=1 Tax=unclassified Streptomyces TaxID=2593676 RepID=UPI0033B24D31
MVEVGPHWDAVRAPVPIGERALKLLSDATGAVIADYGSMYWLIPPGRAQYWRRLRHVQALGAHHAEVTYVGVPSATRTSGPGLHWRIPVGPGRYLTDAVQLRDALAKAAVAELGSAEEETVR